MLSSYRVFRSAPNSTKYLDNLVRFPIFFLTFLIKFGFQRQIFFSRSLQYQILLKSVEWDPSFRRVDGRTDRQTWLKLIGDFCDSTNESKNRKNRRYKPPLWDCKDTTLYLTPTVHSPTHWTTRVTTHTCYMLRILRKLYWFNMDSCRSQWPCGLRRRSSAARLLRSWVRIPPKAWMFVLWVLCVVR